MSLIPQLAAFVTTASAAALPETERACLRRHVADVCVAFFAGLRTGEAAHLRALSPQAADFEAIATAAAIVRHSEVDDIHLPSCVTPSSVAVPVALMLAAREPLVEADRVASAIWVATELVVRFGIAIDGAKILYRGVWPTCIAAPLGAAAAACRIWGLEADQTAQALSLALMMAGGRTGRFQGPLPGRWILFMAGIADGLRAANAARAGFCGDPALLDGAWLNQAQGIDADLAAMTHELGTGSIYPSLSMKPFCTARQGLAATQAFIDLLDAGLDPRSIESIRVFAPPAYAGMIGQTAHSASRTSGFVSVGFQMGLAAFRRDHLWDLDRASVMDDPQVLGLAQRVTVEPDAALAADFPRRWAARIEVRAAGRTEERTLTVAPGDPDARLDDDAFVRKAHRILDPLFGAPQADELLWLAGEGLSSDLALAKLASAFAAAAQG